MILPSLSATGADLGATSAEVGLIMSVYLVSLGAAPLAYGPISDRFGRKCIVVFGCVLVVIASIGCAFSVSLRQLLFFRVLQGAGASATAVAAVAIVRDIFDGAAAAAKISNVILAIYLVPMFAPTVGAALLAFSSWRAIHLFPIVGALVLLAAMCGFTESARIDPKARLSPAAILWNYVRLSRHPICLGNILCNAAAAGAVFAYVTGSSLLLITGLGFHPHQYGLIFGASALSVIAGTRVNIILGGLELAPTKVVALGLILSTMLAACLLVMALAGGQSGAVVIFVMIGVAFSFGLMSPCLINEALAPLPDIMGSINAARTFVQMMSAALSSAVVAGLFDGHSAFSMAVVMLAFCLLADATYIWIVLSAKNL